MPVVESVPEDDAAAARRYSGRPNLYPKGATPTARLMAYVGRSVDPRPTQTSQMRAVVVQFVAAQSHRRTSEGISPPAMTCRVIGVSAANNSSTSSSLSASSADRASRVG